MEVSGALQGNGRGMPRAIQAHTPACLPAGFGAPGQVSGGGERFPDPGTTDSADRGVSRARLILYGGRNLQIQAGLGVCGQRLVGCRGHAQDDNQHAQQGEAVNELAVSHDASFP